MARKRSKLISVLIAVLMVVSMTALAAPATAEESCGCTTCGEWQVFPLYAGQNWEVGKVLVNNCEDQVGVQYILNDAVTDEEWRITEIHLAIGDSLTDIPQTKTGNPIPGQFPTQQYFETGVTATDVYCFPREASWAIGTKLYVAAHAVVGRPSASHTELRSFCITSSPTARVVEGGIGVPATLAWVHPLWNPSLTMPLWQDASWIWESYRVINPVAGDIVEFSHEFEIEGNPLSGMLYITADNGFEAACNTNLVGDSTNLGAGWRTSDLTEPFVSTAAGISSWSTVRSFDVAPYLATGTNELAVTGVNEQQTGGTVDSNPGGVIYKLCGTSEVEILDRESAEETAWGGDKGFRGKNWATYLEYVIQGCCTPCTAPYYPLRVTGFEQGLRKDGGAVRIGRSNPDAVLTYEKSQNETNFFSLGYEGWWMGEFECPVPNGEGDDFRVVEDTWGTYPLESADVFVSQDGDSWVYMGVADNANRDADFNIHTEDYFDLADVGLDWFKFIKIVDTTPVPASGYLDSDGYDLNTIEALHSSETCR